MIDDLEKMFAYSPLAVFAFIGLSLYLVLTVAYIAYKAEGHITMLIGIFGAPVMAGVISMAFYMLKDFLGI